MGKKKITYKDVDWELYRDNVMANISNERIWGLGGSEFADDNISALENELDMIDNEEFEELFNMYDIDVWKDYLKC
jgi:hypothetical protein